MKDTPSDVTADFLKNNFLENPALSIVRNVDNMDEIWKRLKCQYGDLKTMLSKKLNVLNKFEVIWKMKDSQKISEGLSKIINLMKDLMSLCVKHDIEQNLYHSDGLEKIYKLLGDSRVIRWLNISCNKYLESKEL